MNLPKYRAAVHSAQSRFRNAVEEASEILAKDLMAADDQFFEQQDKPVAVDENYAETRRRP